MTAPSQLTTTSEVADWPATEAVALALAMHWRRYRTGTFGGTGLATRSLLVGCQVRVMTIWAELWLMVPLADLARVPNWKPPRKEPVMPPVVVVVGWPVEALLLSVLRLTVLLRPVLVVVA